MKSDILFFIELAISFLPFILFAYLNSKANVKKENRNRQYAMPVFSVIYSAVLLIFLDKLARLCTDLFLKLAGLIEKVEFLSFVADFIRDIYTSWGIYLELVLFNTAAMLLYIILKRIITAIVGKVRITPGSLIGNAVEILYTYDEEDDCWYIKDHYSQARMFIKTAYYAGCVASGLAMLVSCGLCMNNLVGAPFYPVFAIIVIGEMAFFIDGLSGDERKSSFAMQADNSRRMAMYPLLRKPLKALFGDKLSADGTTVNNGGVNGGAIEDILSDLEQNEDHIGKNYACFIRKKMEAGLKPNVDYVRSGYDLSVGKSLLFNTPFYDKLNPYVFYAMNRELLTGGKILIVLGRHGTEEDLLQWSKAGMQAVSNIPDFWNIEVLSGEKVNEENLPDIGIISRSGVHDLDIHKRNLPFLRKVSFMVVVEPSRLVTTAQIGLKLLIQCCGQDRPITFCSVDRNCDGLVDALSHILMTNITEVSATEYPHGMSSYMYWTADNEYLQHRILPGVSRCLGMGTELSMVALKNQVKKTVWYGGDTFPVLDARWIAKQYYHDLLDYAQLPANQETFDRYFQTSINMCDERVNDYSFITVEDDRNNLFETRRNFATISEQQGFVNVISSEYMLREYMSANSQLFTADAKAIPYITADYARSRRNAILSMCLLMCVDRVHEEALNRQMMMLNIEAQDPISVFWREVCVIFGDVTDIDKNGDPILSVKSADGRTVSFERSTTVLFKRAYSMETGKFESIYTIEKPEFLRLILDDLQNASYIAEQESKDVYIGTELKGHVYQKYLPGQFLTLNGKYYEMISAATDNRILVRRAADHIGGRMTYRQLRNYTIHHLEDSADMGALKTVNNIDIHYQYADFSVDTPGFWSMQAHNDFDNGDLVMINGVPTREYRHKQILKFDFSALGESFTDAVRMTLTNLLNETFVTLFAENQAFISAVTPGSYEAPLTYSLALEEDAESAEKCIFIIEDSQLDIGLLIAVERNVNRIFQIVADYLAWNDEQIAESMGLGTDEAEEAEPADEEEIPEEAGTGKKKGIFGKFRDLFRRKKKKDVQQTEAVVDYKMIYGKPHKLVDGEWVPCSQKEFDKRMRHRHELIEQQEAEEKEAQTADEAPDDSIGGEMDDGLTDKERRKAEKAAAKAAKKAEKERKKAARAEAKAAKKAQKEASAADAAEESQSESCEVSEDG